MPPGFQQGQLSGAHAQPVISYPGAQVLVYNPQSKQWEQQQVASSSNAVKAPAGGYRTDRNNNPTAMTTDVAKSSGLVEGKNYVQGDPFTTSNGQTLFTAKLLGDPIDTTIKAIDQGGFYTAADQPRWSYVNQIPDAKNWQNLNHDQKAQVVKQMYKQEGGTALNGPQQYDPKNPVDSLARTWLQTGQSNRSRQDAPEGTIEARGRELAQQFGLPSDFNPATASASVKADIGSLVDLQGRLDNSNASLKIVNDNSDLLLKGMQTAGINPNAPFVNELQNAADQKLIGSGDFAAFELADDRQRRIRKPAQGHPPIC